MKHLILGSSGQIGKHLCSNLILQNYEVITFDIQDTISQDLRVYNNTELNDKIGECDFVYFLAFDVGGSYYMKTYQNTFEFISNNIKIMNNTFDVLDKFNKPFIFASSQMSNMHHSTYGVLKSIGERFTTSLSGLNVKFWNVYGYETDTAKFHVISDFIRMAKYEGVIRMKTNGNESRQFLHGDDAAKCLITLSEKYNDISKEHPVDITSFDWKTIYEVAEIIQKISKCKIIKGQDDDTIQLDQRNSPTSTILDFWKPTTRLEQGIAELYAKF